jgi:hypothetical protein
MSGPSITLETNFSKRWRAAAAGEPQTLDRNEILMCLKLTVRVPAANRPDLEAAMLQVPAGDLHVGLAHLPRWPWARDRAAEVVVSEQGGCACSMLTDQADWSADAWAMRSQVLEPLARTLYTLTQDGPEGMTVEALWAGDEPNQEQKVTAMELSALARASQLGTHTRYVLSRG